jgi:hypothetical protein
MGQGRMGQDGTGAGAGQDRAGEAAVGADTSVSLCRSMFYCLAGCSRRRREHDTSCNSACVAARS